MKSLTKTLLSLGLFFLLVAQFIYPKTSPTVISILGAVLLLHVLSFIKYKKKIDKQIMSPFIILGIYNIVLCGDILPFFFFFPPFLLIFPITWFLIYHISKLYYIRDIWFTVFMIFNCSAPFWIIKLNNWKNINVGCQNFWGSLFYQISVFIFLKLILSKSTALQGEKNGIQDTEE